MKNIFKNKKTLVAVLATLGIILTTLGITVAWFSYARNGVRENGISSGSITFIYEENEDVGNGILLEDAMPMPDSYGKAQTDWFDFKVKSTSGVAKIPYEITLRKTAGSDDIGDSVKVYLTKVNGNNEEEKVLSIYNSLANSTNEIASINNEKTLYKSSIPAGAKNYTDNYRLRIWLNDNPSDGTVLSYEQTVTQECSDSNYDNKTDCEANHANWLDVATPATAKNFTVKVNVYANGEAATQEEIATADSTGISDIAVNETSATENEDETQNYDYSVTTTSGNITINVDTSNSNATADVTEYNPENPTAMNSSIRRLSTSKTFPVTKGDNYFKVTVTSANKQKTKDYILKVIKVASTISTLSSLNIADCPLNQEFSSSTTEYTCTTELTSLDVEAITTDTNATVALTGDTDLKKGDNTLTVKVTAEDGKTTKIYNIKVTVTNKQVSGDSILQILKDNELTSGYYSFIVNDKVYSVHLYNYEGDQEWSETMVFGDASDCASGTATTQMAQNMVVVKVNGKLTNAGTIRPYYHPSYGGPKGFTLYVTGTLNNTSEGKIDNSHGAYANGEDVYLFKNANNTYEYIPAVGASGAAKVVSSSSKTPGSAGNSGSNSAILATSLVKRATGGGGSGAARYTSSEAGATGTSYSGGSGGGGAAELDSTKTVTSGKANGGAGGNGQRSNSSSSLKGGGGAGNPGGSGADFNNGNGTNWLGSINKGANGTGGLLVIYANSFINAGDITANGSSGGAGTNVTAGGSSGGGSINIFYMNDYQNTKTITAAGGQVLSAATKGGAGGAGTVNAGSIASGTYVAN